MQLEQLNPNSLKKRLEALVGTSIKDVLKNPLQVALALDEKLPGMSVQVLSLAAELIEPHLRGVGYRIIEFTDDHITSALPARKKNRSIWTNEIQNGAVVSCAEFSMRLLLQRYLDPRSTQVRFKEMTVKRMGELKDELLITFQLSSTVKEAFLLNLFSQGKAQLELESVIYNSKKQIVAQVSTILTARSAPQIES